MNKKEERKFTNNPEESVSNLKKIIVRSIIFFLIASGLFAATMCIELLGPLGLTWNDNRYRVLSDSFFVSGAMMALFWGIIWVSQKGAFDLLAYSMRKILNFMFRIHPEDSNLPPTYLDYVEQKRAKRKDLHYEAFVIGVTFVTLGVIFALLSL